MIPWNSSSLPIGSCRQIAYPTGNTWQFNMNKLQLTIESIKMLFTGQASINDMSGPVGVVSYIGETYQESQSSGGFYVWLNMLNISILLTANLGVMNLLPIPALDGGRLVFLIIELIRGKRIDPEKEGMVHFVGLMILMLLMVVVMFNDVRKIFF